MYYRPVGSWVAVPTPYNDKGHVDFDVFAQIVDFHLRHGTSTLLVMGSAGEVTLLSSNERREIIREVTTSGRGKIPVFFGTSCSSTRDTVELSQFAETCGADGVVLSVPPYLNAPQEAVYQHFETVMESIRIPVGLYNNPARVVVNIDPVTITRLSERFEHFVIAKEAMPRNSQLLEIMELCKGRLHVMCCDYPGYSIILTTLAMGGHGTANISGNLIPEEMATISRPWTDWKDVVAARGLYMKYLPLMRVLYTVTNPIMIKAGLRILGFRVGTGRRPLPDISPEKAVELERLMREQGIIDKYAIT